jgi:carbamoyl-phosphate synthase large subunit
MAQELLPGRNFNWTGIYRRGELVAAAAMERISYWLGQLVPSGITGQVRQAVTVVDPRLDAVGDLAARALEASPDGIFSVDLRENAAGEPRLNEVNPRPAGRPWLYACAGVNIPLAALRSRLGLPLGEAVAPAGLRAGIRLFRQLDSEPVVVDDAGFDARGID